MFHESNTTLILGEDLWMELRSRPLGTTPPAHAEDRLASQLLMPPKIENCSESHVLANQSELNSDLESRARRVHFGPLPEKHFAPITSLKLQRRNKKSKKRRTSSSSSSSSGSSQSSPSKSSDDTGSLTSVSLDDYPSVAELENLEPERLLQEAIYFRSLLLASEKRERAAKQRELALKQDIATTKSLLNYYKTQAPAATVPKVHRDIKELFTTTMVLTKELAEKDN